MSIPAYTAVSTRRMFAPPPPPPLHPPPPPTSYAAAAQAAPLAPGPAAKTTFSPEVRAYVQRCFSSENKYSDVSIDDMQAKLKVIISDAVSRGTIDMIDWSTAALPQQVIKQERLQQQQQQAAGLDSGLQSSAGFSRLNLGDPTHSATNPASSKKRKSSDFDDGQDAAGAAPWRQAKVGQDFEDRITHQQTPSKKARKAERKQKFQQDLGLLKNASKLNGDLERRQNRFGDALRSPGSAAGTRAASPPVIQGPVMGTCQELEKSFYRLTSAPRPEAVRPLPVLERALRHVVQRFRQENNYHYLWDQFKSMRQDLTVQHIRNKFTVEVYESHARFALENSDLGEYNACQAQLRTLHKQKLGGHPTEFLAYRILYFISTLNKTGMTSVLADLTAADRASPDVQHALKTRAALALGNYHRFFQLYRDVPALGGYIVDSFLARERLGALAKMSKSYKPHISIPFLTEALAFGSDMECCQFLAEHGGEKLLDDGRAEGGDIRFASGRAGLTFEEQYVAAVRKMEAKA